MRQRILNSLNHHPNKAINRTFFICGIFMILFGLLADHPSRLLPGLLRIVLSPCGLITDYIALGGVGAAFVNAGLVVLAGSLLSKLCRAQYSGKLAAAVFMSGGFALFGKNIVNIWPIYLGVWLYSRVKREPFSKYLTVALFAAALSPMVSEIPYWLTGYPLPIRLLAALAAGVLVGFILPPIAAHSSICHQDYNLFNMGFATGLVGTVFVSVMKNFGYLQVRRFHWSQEYSTVIGLGLILLFTGLIAAGVWLDPHPLTHMKYILRHSGHSVDYLLALGFPPVMVNSGVIGLALTLFLFAIGGDINGPTAGCIISVAGFGACGLHLLNGGCIVIGVLLGVLFNIQHVTDPAVQLSLILCIGLAPIAGAFGPVFGILTGFIHGAVAANVGSLYCALNLYNNGFSTGLVATMVTPVIQAFHRHKKEPPVPEFSYQRKPHPDEI